MRIYIDDKVTLDEITEAILSVREDGGVATLTVNANVDGIDTEVDITFEDNKDFE